MKYLKNIVAVLVLIGIFHMSYSAELSVDEIKVLDANTLSVTLSENPNLEVGEIEWELRILNDVKIRGAFPDETDVKSIELLLEEPLLANTTYSLLTVLGTDGSIDFTTPSSVEWFTASNTMSMQEQDIDSIEVIDNRTLIITYREAFTTSSLEFKLLAESEIKTIEKPDFYESELIITVTPPIESEKNYILMIIEMQDAGGNFLEFDTGIYDFTSPVIDEISQDEIDIDTDPMLEVMEVMQIDTTTSGTWETIMEETLELPQIENISEDMQTDMQAAGVEETPQQSDEIDIEQAASIVTQTPDTGAETWVLILATIVINSFYYLSRRKKTAIIA